MGKENRNILGINFGFDDEKFYVNYYPCDRKVENLRKEFEARARDLTSYSSNLVLGLSSGLDSQSVLHSFYSQDLKIECAFLYHPGFNDNEFLNIKILEKKYNFKCLIVDIDPIKVKDDVMDLHKQLGFPPNQILHRMFLEKLPGDADILQGIHGPDFLNHEGKWYVFETANSFEISRLRSFMSLERSGKVIGWERTPEIMFSLLDDDIVKSFLHAYSYIRNNQLIYKDGTDIPLMDYWDLYIKPFFYGKYWKDELEYFPKYQGCEEIDYVMNGPKHDFNKNFCVVSYDRLLNHFSKFNNDYIKVYQIR